MLFWACHSKTTTKFKRKQWWRSTTSWKPNFKKSRDMKRYSNKLSTCKIWSKHKMMKNLMKLLKLWPKVNARDSDAPVKKVQSTITSWSQCVPRKKKSTLQCMINHPTCLLATTRYQVALTKNILLRKKSSRHLSRTPDRRISKNHKLQL